MGIFSGKEPDAEPEPSESIKRYDAFVERVQAEERAHRDLVGSGSVNYWGEAIRAYGEGRTARAETMLKFAEVEVLRKSAEMQAEMLREMKRQ